MPATIYIFYQFLRRDIYINVRHKWSTILINHSLIFPILFSISFAYILTNTYFGTGNIRTSTIIFAGNIILPMMITAYKITFDLFFDMQNNRFVNYQITLLHPRLVIFERIIFAWLFTFITTLPFYPIAKICVGNHLDLSNTNWFYVVILLLLGSLICVCYHQLFTCILTRTDQISILWVRINNILIVLGGFWIPLQVMHNYSPIIGTFVYLNPMIYLTDGLRSAILGNDPQFLSFSICAPVLLGFSIASTLLTWHFFKKRVDHI